MDRQRIMLNKLMRSIKKEYKLPYGFSECNYIKSTGQQIIDTGIEVNDNLCVSIEFRLASYVSDAGSNKFVCAYWESAGRYRVCKLISNKISIQTMNNGYDVKYINQDENIHKVVYNNEEGHCLFDNVDVGNVYKSMTLTGSKHTLGVFGQLQNNDIGYASNSLVSVEIYSIIMSDRTTNEVLEEFVPCIDRKGVACLYAINERKAHYDIIGSVPFEYSVK